MPLLSWALGRVLLLWAVSDEQTTYGGRGDSRTLWLGRAGMWGFWGCADYGIESQERPTSEQLAVALIPVCDSSASMSGLRMQCVD